MTYGKSGNFGKVDNQKSAEVRHHRGLSDRIASVFLFLALLGKEIDYLLSV
jgi:hypothetical protein